MNEEAASASIIPVRRLIMAGLGVVIATAGFSFVIVQIYRYPPGPMRADCLRWLVLGVAFLFSGRLLRVYGGALLLGLLLVLFALVWLYVAVMFGLESW